MPKDREDTDVPSTIERSDDHAQHIWKKTHDSAVETYGEGERAHRTAFAALKHSYEKVGDHWEPKEDKGPSDERAAKPTPRAAAGEGETHGGVNANASMGHLRDVARRLGVEGRSKMGRQELVEAIDKANQKATAKARERDTSS
ncbi:MAG: ChaB family protein [Actinomycetota bacterium]|nr:ChaB family protein [Actinomycetota bacterium]